MGVNNLVHRINLLQKTIMIILDKGVNFIESNNSLQNVGVPFRKERRKEGGKQLTVFFTNTVVHSVST